MCICISVITSFTRKSKSKRLKDLQINSSCKSNSSRLHASVYIGTLILSVYNIIVRIPHFIGTQKQSRIGAATIIKPISILVGT